MTKTLIDILIGGGAAFVVAFIYLRLAYLRACKNAAEQQNALNQKVKEYGATMYRQGVKDTYATLSKFLEEHKVNGVNLLEAKEKGTN